MKNRPFLIATGVSAALQILYLAAVTGISLLILPGVLQGIPALPNNPSGPPSFPPAYWVSTVIGGVGTLLAPLVYIGTGVLYAFLHGREASSLTPEQGAVGGAASAALARILTGLVNAFLSTFTSVYLMQTFSSQAGVSPGDIPPETLPFFLGFSVVGGLIGTIMSMCFGAVFAAGMGAIGGALTGALRR